MRGKAKLKKTTLSKQSQHKEPLLPIALLDLENTLRTEMHELVFPLKEKLTQYESNLKDIHGLVPKEQKLDLACSIKGLYDLSNKTQHHNEKIMSIFKTLDGLKSIAPGLEKLNNEIQRIDTKFTEEFYKNKLNLDTIKGKVKNLEGEMKYLSQSSGSQNSRIDSFQAFLEAIKEQLANTQLTHKVELDQRIYTLKNQFFEVDKKVTENDSRMEMFQTQFENYSLLVKKQNFDPKIKLLRADLEELDQDKADVNEFKKFSHFCKREIQNLNFRNKNQERIIKDISTEIFDQKIEKLASDVKHKRIPKDTPIHDLFVVNKMERKTSSKKIRKFKTKKKTTISRQSRRENQENSSKLLDSILKQISMDSQLKSKTQHVKDIKKRIKMQSPSSKNKNLNTNLKNRDLNFTLSSQKISLSPNLSREMEHEGGESENSETSKSQDSSVGELPPELKKVSMRSPRPPSKLVQRATITIAVPKLNSNPMKSFDEAIPPKNFSERLSGEDSQLNLPKGSFNSVNSSNTPVPLTRLIDPKLRAFSSKNTLLKLGNGQNVRKSYMARSRRISKKRDSKRPSQFCIPDNLIKSQNNEEVSEDFTEEYTGDLVALEDLDPEVLERINQLDLKIAELDKVFTTKYSEIVKYTRDQFRDLKLQCVQSDHKIDKIREETKKRVFEDSRNKQRDLADLYYSVEKLNDNRTNDLYMIRKKVIEELQSLKSCFKVIVQDIKIQHEYQSQACILPQMAPKLGSKPGSNTASLRSTSPSPYTPGCMTTSEMLTKRQALLSTLPEDYTSAQTTIEQIFQKLSNPHTKPSVTRNKRTGHILKWKSEEPKRKETRKVVFNTTIPKIEIGHLN
ncbi:unnamed protein product [Moneuplotes crassus]|uniref:Uncharacterized protein n=1 Tax=Euplotes crassus TaxID=5936 RepID=A0AAD1XD52_EUPCR|nr:unnamed protein product [Moneuplotes crassus]